MKAEILRDSKQNKEDCIQWTLIEAGSSNPGRDDKTLIISSKRVFHMKTVSW